MKSSIRIKIGLLVAMFVAMMSISLALMFWANHAQKDYALIINLAGRQRMLVQKIVRESVTLARVSESAEARAYSAPPDEIRKELESAKTLFDKTLKAFTSGGDTVGGGGARVVIEPVATPAIQEKLSQAAMLWSDFGKKLEVIISPGSDVKPADFRTALAYVENRSAALIDSMNTLTGLYQKEAERIVGLVEKIQIWMFAATVAFAMISIVVFSRVITRPIKAISGRLKAVADGDLTRESIETRSNDELGEMTRTVNEMTGNLRGIVKAISETSNDVRSVSSEVSLVSDELSKSTEEQILYVKKTSSFVESVNRSMGDIASNTNTLSTTAEEASSSVLEMAASIDEVATIAEGLLSTVEEVSSSIAELAASVKEIVEHTSRLSGSADETASAISEIDASIREVEGNLKVSAKLSEATAQDAAVGRDAVRNTTEAMARIKTTVEDVAGVTRRLTSKSEAIGDILNVINEMAEQTNLLALNAAIIAAQAGEHGKGFAVVSDEIKEFADRTAQSTKEIETLIKSVQSEAFNATRSVETVGKSVEAGVELAKRAGEALDKILKSANSSSQMVEQISVASAEQLRGSQQVTAAMDSVTEMLKKVYKAIEDQERGSAYIAEAAEKMRDAAVQVSRATKEQSSGGEIISRSIENISERVKAIDVSTQGQSGSVKDALKAIESARLMTEKNVTIAKKMMRVSDMLVERTNTLNGTLKKVQK